MPNAINYVDMYQEGLDQALVQGALTADLEAAAGTLNFLNAKTFKVQHLSVSGYKPHTRTKGYNEGSVTTTEDLYTLDQDRDIEFFVDKADVDESNQAASAANITRIFTQEHATPEIDAYRFSKLATLAQQYQDSLGTQLAKPYAQELALTTDNVYGAIKDAIFPIRKYGPQNIIVYVSSETMDLLERSKDFTRKIDVTNNNGTIESRVTSIDGVELREVWAEERFKTEFDFTEGFVPTANAKDIQVLGVVKPNIIAKAKFNSVYLFAPGQHTEGDGWLYQNRIYHGLFVLKHKQDSITVVTKPAS
ncbi:hypothetical protein [Bacillus smithii]|uniref:hypothetical protein n=1 Tax=Bacillus smithii TaxID=1479 RepID=UPI0030C9E076